MTPKQILINDLRRELRWAYKDQSTDNIGRLTKSVTALVHEGDETARPVAMAAAAYVFFLKAVKRQINDETMRNVRVHARILVDRLRSWEAA